MSDTLEIDPHANAADLARYLLNTSDVRIDDVEMFTWMAKAHHLTYDGDKSARLVIAGHGGFGLGLSDGVGGFSRGIRNGHLEETPFGKAARERAADLGRKITGYDVEVRGWTDFSGFASGRHLVPHDETADHSFMMLEIGEDRIAVVRGDYPSGDQVPDFEATPFFQGSPNRFEYPGAGLTCSIRVTDPESFCEAMDITSIHDLTAEALHAHMLNIGADPAAAGLKGVGCGNLRTEHGFLRFDVTAAIDDFGQMVAFARDRWEACWSDRDWYPESPEDALWEIALASNENPSPDEMGFEFVSNTPFPDESPVADPEDETGVEP